MFNRIIGVFKLDAKVFAEIEADQTATSQAAIVVGIVAVLAAIGGVIGTLLGQGDFLASVLFPLIWAFVSWLIWSAVTFFVGTNLFGGDADLGEMLRVIGFAQAPLMLQIIPCVGGVIGWIWSLVASFIAIREGLDFDTGKAIATVVIGWLIVFILNFVLLSVLGIGAFGANLLGGVLGG
ncbi:MAG: YIP1 family protein [Anaerolineae bacterium]